MRYGAASIAIAFLLGTLSGARAWDAWRDREHQAADESVVDLTARVHDAAIEGGDTTRVQVHVQLENDGPKPVRIEELRIEGPGYVSTPSERPVTVRSDGVVTSRIDLHVVCNGSPHAASRVSVRVGTADGQSRPVLLPLLDLDRELSLTRNLACQSDDGLWVRVLGDNPDASVTTSEGMSVYVWLESASQPSITITSIRGTSRQLDVVADGLPIEIPGGLNAYAGTFLTWRVQDCKAAATLDYADLDVVVSGSRAGHPPTETTVALDPDLALDIAAYVRAMCSQR